MCPTETVTRIDFSHRASDFYMSLSIKNYDSLLWQRFSKDSVTEQGVHDLVLIVGVSNDAHLSQPFQYLINDVTRKLSSLMCFKYSLQLRPAGRADISQVIEDNSIALGMSNEPRNLVSSLAAS